MNILKQLLLKLLNNEIRQIKQEQYDQGYTLGKFYTDQERRAERLCAKETVMKGDIDEKVIFCSNEWKDPVFAVIEGLQHFGNTDGPMYKARNVLTNETVYFFEGTLYLADEKMVDCILKLNPFERWNMNLSKGYIGDNMWSKWYQPKQDITDPTILKQRLKEVNFI